MGDKCTCTHVETKLIIQMPNHIGVFEDWNVIDIWHQILTMLNSCLVLLWTICGVYVCYSGMAFVISRNKMFVFCGRHSHKHIHRTFVLLVLIQRLLSVFFQMEHSHAFKSSVRKFCILAYRLKHRSEHGNIWQVYAVV